MKKHTRHLDHHQRSHLRHDWTKRIGLESCSTTRRESCSTARRRSCSTSKILPTNPNQSQNQSVIDQGNLITNTKCLLMKAKHPWSREISVNSFNEELCSSDRSGQPGITQDVISVQACSSEDSKSLNV